MRAANGLNARRKATPLAALCTKPIIVTAYTISVIPKDAQEVWLMNMDICETSKACLPLEKFVKENYTIIETKDFYKEQIRLLRKK
jgi:hypothetical protein